MKQIPFDAELIGKPGIEVKYRNGEKPDFVKVYETVIVGIDSSGDNWVNNLNGTYIEEKEEHECDLLMYRQTRTAEEIAREVVDNFGPNSELISWSRWEHSGYPFKDIYIALVQAGMDEMTNQ